MKYYTKKDVEHIAYIGGIASQFASLIDTKIIEVGSRKRNYNKCN